MNLLQAALGSAVFWTGEINYPFPIITTNAAIPTGTSTITFTFHQSYDNFDGTERIVINLVTNGCQNTPIDSAPPTPTPTLTPTIISTSSLTPTNPAACIGFLQRSIHLQRRREAGKINPQHEYHLDHYLLCRRALRDCRNVYRYTSKQVLLCGFTENRHAEQWYTLLHVD